MSRPTGPPDVRTLLDWLEHRLAPQPAADVERAVADGGPELHATVAWLRNFVETTDRHRLESAPGVVVHRLARDFADWTHGSPHPQQVGRHVEASLVFDSREDQPRAAVRSTPAVSTAYQLAYTSDAGDVVLDVFGVPDGSVRVEGQVFATPATGRSFLGELTPGTAPSVWGTSDVHGRFQLAEVPAVQAQLRLDDGDLSLTLTVPLGPPA